MTYKKNILTCSILTTLALSGCNVSTLDSVEQSNSTPAAGNGQPVIVAPKNDENRYVVVYNQTARGLNSVRRDNGEFSSRRAERTLSDIKISSKNIIQHLPNNNATVVTLTAEEVSQLQTLATIETSPIAMVEPDVKRQLIAPLLDDSPLLQANTTPYGIQLVQADKVSDQLAGNQTLCIIDSGYDIAHEDLQDNGVTGGNTAASAGQWNYDGSSHGTHVAGTIAALGGNGVGVRGVNHSGNLNLHIVKVFTADGWAWGSDLVKAIQQCNDNNAKVVSMSLGGGGASNYERNAMDNFYSDGMLLIAAAGNDGNSRKSYPASYDAVMSVAAVDRNSNKASFSQYNSQVEISGPGVSVMSTVPNNRYASYNGTSMATPHVSGVASLVWSHYPDCSAADVRSAMNESAKDLGSSGRDNSYGYGLVQALDMKNALGAKNCSGQTNPPTDPEPTDPTITDLTNGVAQTNLSASQSASMPTTAFRISVPEDATDLSISITGGSGDADLYVRHSSEPELKSYTCRPYGWGNNETCNIAKPKAGDWYVMLHAYNNFSGVALTASFNDPVSKVIRVEHNKLSAAKGDMLTEKDGTDFKVAITDQVNKLTITTARGTGDVDLYVRHSEQPTRRLFDCKPFKDGNEEACVIEGADLKTGDWFIGLQGFEDFADVSLFIDIENK